MNEKSTELKKVVTEKVVGFSQAVKRLGKHVVCGQDVYYRPEYIRQVLKGEQKSEKILELIAKKVPEMFEVCNCCDEVLAWWKQYKKGAK